MIQSINPKAFKRIVIDNSLSDKQLESLGNISELAIIDAAKKKPLKEIFEQTKLYMDAFSSEFDSNKISAIDGVYTKLMDFVNFVQFDYFFMLKKFDSSLKEHNFSNPPRFIPISGTYVLEDLKNFMDVAWSLPFDSSWDEVFKLIKKVKGVDPVSPGVWKKFLHESAI